jgi:hypothetical protein
MYTNMKTQNTNNDKIATITSQTGFSYIPKLTIAAAICSGVREMSP